MERSTILEQSMYRFGGTHLVAEVSSPRRIRKAVRRRP